ncbi:MAG: NAD(P)-binding protein [Pseudonocardiaceae bacterium]
MEVRLLDSGSKLENSIGRIAGTHLELLAGSRDSTDGGKPTAVSPIPVSSCHRRRRQAPSGPIRCAGKHGSPAGRHNHGADTTLDAVVIGGRSAGAVCAATLAKHGRSVMVLERRAFPGFTSASQVFPKRGKVTSRTRFRSNKSLFDKMLDFAQDTTSATALATIFFSDRQPRRLLGVDHIFRDGYGYSSEPKHGLFRINYVLRRRTYWNRK